MKSKFKVTKSVPMSDYSAPGSPKYPWADLEVGTSFDVPLGDNPESLRISLYTNAKKWFERNRNSTVKISIEKLDTILRVRRTA